MNLNVSRLKGIALVPAFAVISLVLPSVASAQFGISLTENSDGTLTVFDNNASDPAIVVGGTTDDWTLDFSALGMSFGGGGIGMTWKEAPGEPGVNLLQQDPNNANVLDLLSEDIDPAVQPGVYAPACGNSNGPLDDGVSCLIGVNSSGSYFASVNEPAAGATPEPASLLLSGLGLAGLAIAGIRRKRKA